MKNRLLLLFVLTITHLMAIADVSGDSTSNIIPNPYLSLSAFPDSMVTTKTPEPVKAKKWYESIQIRGYAQVRYNRLLETNDKLNCEQCDKSWGDNGGFFLRRMRIIFFGDVHERVYIYIQPDFASAPSSSTAHFAQLRDAYFDLALNKQKTYRIRFGQSKVPFGFENMQSSQNRIPLDRNDALNSAVANERDFGAFFYWAPKKIRERFSYLVSSGLKGSGDYGVFGYGLYNGQTANKPEANNNLHQVVRLTYPFLIGSKQIIEPGVQAYSGRVVVTSVNSSKNVVGINPDFDYLDERIAGTFVLYPQPFGIQAEANIGTGPEYNPVTNTIEQKKLEGWYTTFSYLFKWKNQTFIPFARYQYYKGGKKQETDARSYRVYESEFGIEWQPIKNFELVAMYTTSDRTFVDASKPVNQQAGSLLRLQFQFNF